MSTFDETIAKFREFLESPSIPDDYRSVPSRTRPGKTSYQKIVNGRVSFTTTIYPMSREFSDLMNEAANSFYVSEIMFESVAIEGMKLMDLQYNDEMEDTLYELIKKFMNEDRFMSNEEKLSNFNEMVQTRNDERCTEVRVPCAEEVHGIIEEHLLPSGEGVLAMPVQGLSISNGGDTSSTSDDEEEDTNE
jgi:hypothetical protein